jgi:ribosomal protein L15E
MKTVTTKLVFGKAYRFTVEGDAYSSTETLEVINSYLVQSYADDT